MSHCPHEAVESFITRWENSGAAERANYQMFLAELCDILGIPRPDPTTPDPEGNHYVFDRAITRINPDGTTSTNYIDFYKAAHFVCETKQGVDDSAPSSVPTTKAATTSPTSPRPMAARHSSSSATSAIPSTSTPSSPAPVGATSASPIPPTTASC